MKILAYGHSALATSFGTPSASRGWCEALAKAGAQVTLASDADTPVVAQPAGGADWIKTSITTFRASGAAVCGPPRA